MMMNRVVKMCSVYTDCHQCDLRKRQQSWIGGLGRARCDDIGDLNGVVFSVPVYGTRALFSED